MKDRLRYKNEGNQWTGVVNYIEYKCKCGEWIRIREDCEGQRKDYYFCPNCGKAVPWKDIAEQQSNL